MSREKIPTTTEERAAWVLYQLRLKKSSFAKIAKRYGVCAQTVRRAMYIKYPKWDHIICQEIGQSPAEVFPERYAA